MQKFRLFILSALLTVSLNAFCVTISSSDTVNFSQDECSVIQEQLKNYLSDKAAISVPIVIESVNLNKKVLNITFNKALADYSFREETLKEIYNIVRNNIPDSYKDYDIALYCNGSKLDDLQSVFYSSEGYKNNRLFGVKARRAVESQELKNLKQGRKQQGMRDNVSRLSSEGRLVSNISLPYNISDGLQDRHIALWQSHGYYYDQKLQRWEWQRARIFQTVEDIYTQSYVLPFLVPMLENAGAVVMLPRERDCQIDEIIVDNDTTFSAESGKYSESNGLYSWKDGDSLGFANPKSCYSFGENPFRMGKYREISGVKKSKKVKESSLSTISWLPYVKKRGDYAVYVSYHTLKNSASDVYYTVKHAGGQTQFKVNQKMGGGTWVYLGTFKFSQESGVQGVYLTNITNSSNTVITADAVKFGGGMGNMMREPNKDGAVDNVKSSDLKVQEPERIDYFVESQVSGYPRIKEGARYWLQWAGFADTVYSSTKNTNDYNDDYTSRGRWVNALSGGSSKNNRNTGLNIPIDLSFAFHTDAGTFKTDSIVGTLSIYTRFSNDNDVLPNGLGRLANRELADLVQTQIVDDIRALHEPNWSRRGLWDRSYSESRSPEVPSMLLELLSHQNFADMRYGLDPAFRFTVSRAIYKGIVKFFSLQNGKKFTIQPLPIKNFGAVVKDDKVILSWSPVYDKLESSAVPTKYAVYRRSADGGFDNGVVVSDTSYTTYIQSDVVNSFKVVALNDGGASFPSEILSVGRVNNPKGEVLVINGFERVSAPASFKSDDESIAGFNNMLDTGVPYLNDYSFIGAQHEYRRDIPWMDDDAPGFGASFADYEDKIIAGNSFDYPADHGYALMQLGYNFVSSSVGSVIAGKTDLNSYMFLDFIMGKQAKTRMGRGAMPAEYAVFPDSLQKLIKNYKDNVSGGAILISGANIGRDLWDNIDIKASDKEFGSNVLQYKFMTHYASTDGRVKSVSNPFGFKGSYTFETQLNPDKYAVEAADAVVPVGDGAYTVFRYSQNNISAGVAFDNQAKGVKGVMLGFPIETLKSREEMINLMGEIFDFFIRE